VRVVSPLTSSFAEQRGYRLDRAKLLKESAWIGFDCDDAAALGGTLALRRVLLGGETTSRSRIRRITEK
jgi:hypothetical protein